MILLKTLPLPALAESDTVLRRVGLYDVDKIVGYRHGRGKRGFHNCIYLLRLKGYGLQADIEYRAQAIPQFEEITAAYRAEHGFDEIASPPQNNKLLRAWKIEVASEEMRE